MPTRLIALFNLKPGVTREAYETWACAVDIPTVRKLGSIAGFEVFHTTGVLGSDAAPPYSFVEIIDVADMAQFGHDIATATMQAISATFAQMADVVFMTTEPVGP